MLQICTYSLVVWSAQHASSLHGLCNAAACMTRLCPADNGTSHYSVSVETGEVSNLAAELGTVSFKSGEGISPGRLVRLAHALARACLLTFKGETASLKLCSADRGERHGLNMSVCRSSKQT